MRGGAMTRPWGDGTLLPRTDISESVSLPEFVRFVRFDAAKQGKSLFQSGKIRKFPRYAFAFFAHLVQVGRISHRTPPFSNKRQSLVGSAQVHQGQGQINVKRRLLPIMDLLYALVGANSVLASAFDEWELAVPDVG